MLLVWFAVCAAQRPPVSQRRFVSAAVDRYIADTTPRIQDPVLAAMFAQALPNTLDTTVYYDSKQLDTFVVTGDINAMVCFD